MTSIADGSVKIQTMPEPNFSPPSLYVKILVDPFKQGSSRVEPIQESCWGKAPAFIRLDLPLAAFLGQSMIGGLLRSATQYRRTRHLPGAFVERSDTDVVCWTRLE
jgi:hypothetical protein